MICTYGASRSSITASLLTSQRISCSARRPGEGARHLSQQPSSLSAVTGRCVSAGRQQVTKNYSARLATRITPGVDARLRQLALVRRRRISHVLDEVLDAALPKAADLITEMASLGCDVKEAADGRR